MKTPAMEQFREAGLSAIRDGGRHGYPVLRLAQGGVVFRQMFEYPVRDFEAEVGFYVRVFGLPTAALTEDYALFAHPEGAYCFSFRKDEAMALPSSIGLKLLFMTADIEGAAADLRRSEMVPDLRIDEGSAVQRVLLFVTPGGVAIEIWEDPSPGLA